MGIEHYPLKAAERKIQEELSPVRRSSFEFDQAGKLLGNQKLRRGFRHICIPAAGLGYATNPEPYPVSVGVFATILVQALVSPPSGRRARVRHENEVKLARALRRRRYIERQTAGEQRQIELPLEGQGEQIINVHPQAKRFEVPDVLLEYVARGIKWSIEAASIDNSAGVYDNFAAAAADGRLREAILDKLEQVVGRLGGRHQHGIIDVGTVIVGDEFTPPFESAVLDRIPIDPKEIPQFLSDLAIEIAEQVKNGVTVGGDWGKLAMKDDKTVVLQTNQLPKSTFQQRQRARVMIT